MSNGAFHRLYSGGDGESHMEELDLADHPELTNLHGASGIVFKSYPPDYFSDFHVAPRRQYVINIAGENEIDDDDLEQRYEGGPKLTEIEIHPLRADPSARVP